MYEIIQRYMGDFNVLSPLALIFMIYKIMSAFRGGQVGDFQVATSGGFWVAVGGGIKIHNIMT